MTTKARGQVLVLVAVLLGVAVIAVMGSFALGTARQQKDAARYVAEIASNIGAAQLDEAALAQGEIRLDVAEATAAARQAVVEALVTLPYALREGYTPELIAGNPELLQIQAVNATPTASWTSPWTGNIYTEPVVAVWLKVPSRVFFLEIDLPVVGETIVMGGQP